MTLNDYNRFCRSLTATTHVVQWEGAHVWKIGGKVFAIGREDDVDGAVHVTFKCSALSYDMLKDMAGCRPAPYLASRGMTWIQRTSAAALDDRGLKDYLRASYDLVIAGLPKRVQQEIGLNGTARDVKSKAEAKTSEVGSSAASKPKSRFEAKAKSKPAATAKAKPQAAQARASTRKGATR